MGTVTSTGIDWKNRKTLMMKGSSHDPRLTAASTPAGMPMRNVSTKAYSPSRKDTQIFGRMTSWTERPRYV